MNTEEGTVNPQNTFEGKSQDKSCERDIKGNQPRTEQIARLQKTFLPDEINNLTNMSDGLEGRFKQVMQYLGLKFSESETNRPNEDNRENKKCNKRGVIKVYYMAQLQQHLYRKCHINIEY